jgi:hypothetical protein
MFLQHTYADVFSTFYSMSVALMCLTVNCPLIYLNFRRFENNICTRQLYGGLLIDPNFLVPVKIFLSTFCVRIFQFFLICLLGTFRYLWTSVRLLVSAVSKFCVCMNTSLSHQLIITSELQNL